MSKLLSLFALFGAMAFAQTTPAPAFSKMPTYLMAGAACNQFASQLCNGFVSGITPVVNSAGIYASVTADIFAQKYTDATTLKTGYVLTPQVRAGAHKVIWSDAKNMLLIGGDVGASFASSGTAGVSISAAGSFTVTYIRQLNTHWAIGVPIRALWVPGVGPAGKGGFNPVAEFGIILKP